MVMKLVRILLVGVLGLVNVGIVQAADKPWKNVTEGSMVSTNGNSKAYTASGKNTFDYNWSRTGLELIGGGLGS
jgi:hypothetical protein